MTPNPYDHGSWIRIPDDCVVSSSFGTDEDVLRFVRRSAILKISTRISNHSVKIYTELGQSHITFKTAEERELFIAACLGSTKPRMAQIELESWCGGGERFIAISTITDAVTLGDRIVVTYRNTSSSYLCGFRKFETEAERAAFLHLIGADTDE